MVEPPATEDVLLVQGIALAKGRNDRGHQVYKTVIAVLVGREFEDRVLHLDDSRQLPGLGIDDTSTTNILNAEVDVLEDAGTLASSAERLDADTHSDEQGEKYQYTD